MAETIRLSFTLTPLQRILNPWIKLCFVLIGIAGIIGTLGASYFLLLIMFTGAFGENSAWAKGALPLWRPLLGFMAIVGFVALLFAAVLPGILAAFRSLMFGKGYINTLVVEDDFVLLGVDGVQVALYREYVKVRRGLLGTIIIGYPARASSIRLSSGVIGFLYPARSYAITIPRTAVSIAELREAVEGGRSEPPLRQDSESAVIANTDGGATPVAALLKHVAGTAESLRLSFALTRLQRILNPWERLIILFFSVAMLLLVPVTVFVECRARGSSLLDGGTMIVSLVIEGIVVALVLLFFRNPLFTFIYALLGTHYLNTLLIKGDCVLFGVDEPQLAVNRQLLRVGRGLLGTLVIHHPHGSITLPQSAVSLAELKEVLERDDSIQ